MVPKLGEISFSFGIVDVWCLIDKDTHHFQFPNTCTLGPSSILFDVLEYQGEIPLGPSGMYIAHHPHICMACELQYLSLIVFVWHIIKSWTIEWIDHHGKGDVGIGGNAITDQPMPRWLTRAGIS